MCLPCRPSYWVRQNDMHGTSPSNWPASNVEPWRYASLRATSQGPRLDPCGPRTTSIELRQVAPRGHTNIISYKMILFCVQWFFWASPAQNMQKFNQFCKNVGSRFKKCKVCQVVLIWSSPDLSRRTSPYRASPVFFFFCWNLCLSFFPTQIMFLCKNETFML